MVAEGTDVRGGLLRLGEGIMGALLKRGADEVMVIPSHTDKMMVRFSNNRVTVVQNWNVRGAEVLALFGKRRIVSRFEDVSKGALEAGVGRIAREAKAVPEAQELPGMPPPEAFRDHITGERIDADRIGEGVGGAIGSALAAGAERVSGVFTATITRDALMGSNGARGYDERPLYELNVRAFEGEASGQGISCSTRIGGIDPDGAGRDAGNVVKLSSTTATWQEGRCDVLFGPIIGANLVERVGDACSAFSVEAGISCLAGKVGQKVFSECMSITDDGTSDESLNARLFDDEGTPTEPTILVEGGTLRSYLHNSYTAKRFNAVSTGNAGWISPSPWSLVVGRGGLGFEEMLKELREGVYMVSNWYTRFQNYSTGDFSTISRDGAFLVKGGEVVGAIKGVRVSDNLNRLFSAVDLVGRERKWTKWWEVRTPALMPAVVSRGVNLTKAQGS